MEIKEELRKQVNEIFDEFGLGDLSEEEKRALEEKIMDRFDRVILEAVLLSLNDKQMDEFEKAVADGENTDALIADLVSTIPELPARIDLAIRNEWEGIKKSISSAA